MNRYQKSQPAKNLHRFGQAENDLPAQTLQMQYGLNGDSLPAALIVPPGNTLLHLEIPTLRIKRSNIRESL